MSHLVWDNIYLLAPSWIQATVPFTFTAAGRSFSARERVCMLDALLGHGKVDSCVATTGVGLVLFSMCPKSWISRWKNLCRISRSRLKKCHSSLWKRWTGKLRRSHHEEYHHLSCAKWEIERLLPDTQSTVLLLLFAKDTAKEISGAIKKLLKEPNLITLYVPLLASTRRLDGKKELDSMKEMAILVDCARGIVGEQTLRERRGSGSRCYMHFKLTHQLLGRIRISWISRMWLSRSMLGWVRCETEWLLSFWRI